MAKVDIVLNVGGVRELLQSDEMAAIVEGHAERLTRATGVPYEPNVRVGKTRVSARGFQKLQKERGRQKLKRKGGKQVSGYYRTTKSGKRIWVNSYRRKK